jgi:hypothetical protein
MENYKLALPIGLILALASLLILSGCVSSPPSSAPAQTTGAAVEAKPAANDTLLYSPAPSSGKNASAQGGVRLVFIKFHGDSQCESCTNLGLFANASLEKNYAAQMESGAIQYLNINAQSEPSNPLVVKYRPTHASLYLETTKDGQTSFEELAQAWYYTGDEKQYEQFIVNTVQAKMAG